MKRLFLFSLFILTSCGTSQGVYRNYVISQSTLESNPVEEESAVIEEYAPIVE